MDERDRINTERIISVLREAGGRLPRMELNRRANARWGIVWENVEAPAQEARLLCDDDYHDTVFIVRHPIGPPEDEGCLVIRSPDTLGISKLTKKGFEFTQLAEQGVITWDDFTRFSNRAMEVSRPTPELAECIGRYARGEETLEGVIACLEGIADAEAERQRPEIAA